MKKEIHNLQNLMVFEQVNRQLLMIEGWSKGYLFCKDRFLSQILSICVTNIFEFQLSYFSKNEYFLIELTCYRKVIYL